MESVLAKNGMKLSLIFLDLIDTGDEFLQIFLVHYDAIAVIPIRPSCWQLSCWSERALFSLTTDLSLFASRFGGRPGLGLIIVLQILKSLDLFEFMGPQVGKDRDRERNL